MQLNKDTFADYLKTFSCVYPAPIITTETIYNSYVKYCEKKQETPLTYEEVETRINNVIWSLRIALCHHTRLIESYISL